MTKIVIPGEIMQVRKLFFFKIFKAFIITNWKVQGFFDMMGIKDFREFRYIGRYLRHETLNKRHLWKLWVC